MEENSNQVVFKKIPLEGLLAILEDLFDRGADFIDLYGTPDEVQDQLVIVIPREYINEECNGFVEGEDGTLVIKDEIPPAPPNFDELA